MARKCFISFKTEDGVYKEAIQKMDIDMVDKSLNEAIESDDEDYIMRRIREENLSDSSVTICLIGTRSAENFGYEEQKYIKRELQASLYDGDNNPRSGILGIVLPEMYDLVYKGSYSCHPCGTAINYVNIGNETVISEFHSNYYVSDDKCHHNEDERYCVLVRWDVFIQNPHFYIEQAFSKREHPIAKKVRVRP